MFRFWYRFVPDGIDLIQLQQGRLYFDETVKNQLSDYMGKIFEDMCRYYLMKKSSEGKMNFTIMKIGSWWGTNPITKREEEIDIVGINQVTKQALIGECKYQNQQVKEEVVSKLIERGTLIKAYPNKQFVLCSKTKFDENIKEIANKNNMLLVTLEDLYRA
jgi:AAA+ ATPase superfamily predicted ATPase